jgi:hypothetical protein
LTHSLKTLPPISDWANGRNVPTLGELGRAMSSLSNIALPKPKDWQDFERKTRALFECVLGDPNTQMNGRTGQPQHGVDIPGYRNEIKKALGDPCIAAIF